MCLYRLVSGQLPFDAPSILATLSSIQSDHPIAPVKINSKADQDLSDLAMCLLEKQPEDRPQSAAQVVELLTTPREQWSLQVPTHSNSLQANNGESRPRTRTKTANGSGRKWTTRIAAMLGLLMLGGFGWQIFRITTDQGEIVIETSDDNVEVQVLQHGEIVKVIDTKTKQSFSLKSGQYSFNAVANDSAEADEEGNSFTIEPDTLTMKRGDTVTVTVTVKPNQNANPQVASDIKSESTSPNKPIFEGNTFAQWINILKSNRDYKAQSKAIEACLAIMETEQEQKEILDGVRVFIKTVDRIFQPSTFSRPAAPIYPLSKRIETNEETASFHELILRVFDSCDGAIVFEFFKSEIESGIALSQQACMNWLKTRNGKSVIFDRHTQLTDAIAANFDKPEVRFIAEYLILGTSSDRASMTQLQGSALGKKIKKFVLAASPEQRVAIVNLTFAVFPDDQQILKTYQKDIGDLKLNDTFFNDRNDKFVADWAQVRFELLDFMYDHIATQKYYQAPDVTPTTRQQRLTTASDWLATVIDGISATGDQHFVFKSGSTRGDARILSISYVTKRTLQRVLDIGSDPGNQKIKQRFLPKIENLREAIVREAIERDADSSSVYRAEKKQRLADLDFAIAVFEGNPPAKLPPKSKLKISEELWVAAEGKDEPISKSEPAVKSEPITKKKPVYEGNTFAQWLNILQSNRDYEAQSKALEACLTIMETEQEQKHILDGANVFMKSLDREFGATAFSKTSFLYYQHQAREKNRPKAIVEKEADLVRFHELLFRALNSCDESLVFDFFKTETKGGTRLSQQVLWNWLRAGNSRMFKDRYAELINPFAENFDNRLVRAMTVYIVAGVARGNRGSQAQLQESALGVKVKEFVQTTTPAKRIEVLYLALEIFPDDPQVFQTYQQDLLDPKLNDVFVDLSRGGPRNWVFAKSVHARTRLFTFVQERVWEKQYYEDPNVDAKTRKQRLATAADSLAKVIDGIVAAGDQQLVFTRNWAVIGGERKIMAYDTFELAAFFLHDICDIRSASKDPKVKELLLTKLEQLKAAIVKDEGKSELSDLEKEKANANARRTWLRDRCL